MADAVSQTPEAQIAAPQLSSDHANPSKFFTHFLYKAVLVTVFLVLLPLFPSLAPEFINQTLHARSWELLQLIFVGIAVSYGLFSKKNDETDKDHSSKQDNTQSYVSKLLQVSSVFDDESENQTVIDENKVQTWNSQYYSGEPVVVVAKDSSVVKEENGVASEIRQKPLLLPVRSLKQRVSEPSEVDLADKSGLVNGPSLSPGSKRFTSNSRKPRNGEVGGLNAEKLEGKLEENVVLRSPIPWRSRSGRMEMKENGDGPAAQSILVSPPEEDPELRRLESRSFRSFRPNSSTKNISPSPSISTAQKLSPSASFSSESQAKISEDAVRKKNFSLPPPAPPPPPPPFIWKSVLMKSNSNAASASGSASASSEKVLRRSVRSVPAEELRESSRSDDLRDRIQNDTALGKSVRTFRSSDLLEMGENGKVPNEDQRKQLVDEKVYMETSTDEESDSEAESEDVDYINEGRSSGNGEVEAAANSSANSTTDVGPDVDKKADEFIAKFREQIRLQRIESIRRSTAQRAGKTNLR